MHTLDVIRSSSHRASTATRTSTRLAMLGVALVAVACARGSSPAIDLSPPRTVSTPTGVGTSSMFAVAPSGAEAVAWVSAPDGGTDGRLYLLVAGRPPVELRDSLGPIQAHGEAPPQIAYGPDGSLNALYVVVRVVRGERFPRSALRFVRSTDGGAHWSDPVNVTDGDVFGSHNFQAIGIARDGTIYASWLDGRTGKSTVFVTHSTDGGRTWAPNTQVTAEEACPCCRTALAEDADGTVYIAWRKVYPGPIRDIVVARSTDRGETWSEPVRVHADNWKFDACPHAGPSMRVDSAGVVHIAWWTGKEGAAGVYYAHSDDRGQSFSAPVALGTAEYSRPSHVQLALAGAHTVIAAWDDGTTRVPRVVLRVSRNGGGSFAPAQTVSTQGRSATFPVLAVSDSGIAVAWSQESTEAAAREASSMPDMKDPHATMGLDAVGETHVLVRRGVLE